MKSIYIAVLMQALVNPVNYGEQSAQRQKRLNQRIERTIPLRKLRTPSKKIPNPEREALALAKRDRKHAARRHSYYNQIKCGHYQ